MAGSTTPLDSNTAIHSPPQGTDPRVLLAPRRGVGGFRLLGVVLIGAVAALPFGSRPLATWSDRLPDRYAVVQAVAHRWDAMMQAAGLGMPYNAIHRGVRAIATPREN